MSIVVCTLNEHESIRSVLDELVESMPIDHFEIIVVDDSADERTADAVRSCVPSRGVVRLLHRRGTDGLSAAAIAGWDQARGRLLAVMDGDGQHDPQLMAQMMDAMLQQRPDVVVASRYLDSAKSGLAGFRHVLSRSGVGLTKLMLGIALADPLSGCFMMCRSWFEQVRPHLSGVGFKILVDVVASGDRAPQLVQVPTLLRQRLGGASKMRLRIALDLLWLLVQKRASSRRADLRRPIRWLAGSAIVLLLAVWMAHHLGMSRLPVLGLAVVLILLCERLYVSFSGAGRHAGNNSGGRGR